MKRKNKLETEVAGSIAYNDRRKVKEEKTETLDKKKEYYSISRDLYEVMRSDIRRRKGR
jgi:hypothetical protein|tara:strand:+ start:1781 stop:1957 length:177 start_codon:yes stop_codon:yes gene_type:complete